jgi:hypothetical protein
LAAASDALAAWRKEFGGKGRAIPDALWKMATGVARTEGVAATARALKLDAMRLAARMPTGNEPAVAERQRRFVEIPALSAAGSRAVTVVEFVGREGDRVRVETPSVVGSTEIVELARAFWSRGG